MNTPTISRFFLMTNWVRLNSLLLELDLDPPLKDIDQESGMAMLEEIWRQDPRTEVTLANVALDCWDLVKLACFKGKPLRLQLEWRDLATDEEQLRRWIGDGFGLDIWGYGDHEWAQSSFYDFLSSPQVRVVRICNESLWFGVDRMDPEIRLWFPPEANRSDYFTARDFWLWRQRYPRVDSRLIFYQRIDGGPLRKDVSPYYYDGVTDPLDRACVGPFEWTMTSWLLRSCQRGSVFVFWLIFYFLDFWCSSPRRRWQKLWAFPVESLRISLKLLRFTLGVRT